MMDIKKVASEVGKALGTHPTVGTSGLNASGGVPGCRVEVKDVGEKIGAALGGERGRQIGRALDNKTKDVTIHVGL